MLVSNSPVTYFDYDTWIGVMENINVDRSVT